MDLIEYTGSLLQSLLTELISTAIAIPLVTYLVLKFFQNFRSARIWDASSRLRQMFTPRPYPTLVLSTSSIHFGENNSIVDPKLASVRCGASPCLAAHSLVRTERIPTTDESSSHTNVASTRASWRKTSS